MDIALKPEPVLIPRRRFLGRAACATAGAATTGVATRLLAASDASPPAKGIDSIIDAHLHFYDPTRPDGVPWPPRSDQLLYRRVMPGDYRGLAATTAVAGAVVVEASPWLEDNQWVLDLAQTERFLLGFVGNLAIGTKEFATQLERFAAFSKFRGIRIRDRKLDVLVTDAAFLDDLKMLANQNLLLDLVGGLEILTFADQLAKTLPGLRIIIDHLAGVSIDGKTPPAEWLDKMKVVARHRNVYCKLSGLVEGTGCSDGAAPRGVDFYIPVLTAMLEMFGAERLIYASNWPVSERFAPLAVVQGIVTDFCARQDRSLTRRVFSSNARSAYGLGEDKN